MTRESVWSLLRSLEVMLSTLQDDSLAEFMTHWPDETAEFRHLAPRPLPVLTWLEEARQHGALEAAPTLQHLCNSANELFWGQTYSVGTFGEAFLERYGWCELIGAAGPIVSDSLACGFLMLGPENAYPCHSHDAREIYIPLSSPAQWLCGAEGDWRKLTPMQVIHHPGNAVHGMRTGDAPMISLYMWLGEDLAQRAVIV